MIVDSNLLILASKQNHEDILLWLAEAEVAISAISRVEVLGFQHLPESERLILEEFFQLYPILPITDPVLDEAIRLKQQKKMSLGDSIIAGTAILHGGELATRNLKDFQNIPGLSVSDPTRSAGSPGTL